MICFVPNYRLMNEKECVGLMLITSDFDDLSSSRRSPDLIIPEPLSILLNSLIENIGC